MTNNITLTTPSGKVIINRDGVVVSMKEGYSGSTYVIDGALLDFIVVGVKLLEELDNHKQQQQNGN